MIVSLQTQPVSYTEGYVVSFLTAETTGDISLIPIHFFLSLAFSLVVFLASILSIDTKSATLRILVPEAAAPYLPKLVQLYREDYHVQRPYSSSYSSLSDISDDEDMVFMKQKTASEKKKSPFTYLPHPLRLANRTSLSVGPSLPFSCIYTAGTCNTDYEEAKKRRWELLKPGDHLRIRIAELRRPSDDLLTSSQENDKEEQEEKWRRQQKRDEDRQRKTDETSKEIDEESRPSGHHKEETRQSFPSSSSSGVDRTAEKLREEEEETRTSREEKPIKKRRTAGIGLRFAFGEDGSHAQEWQKWTDVKKEMERRLYGEGGEGGERRRVEEEILAKRLDEGLHTLYVHKM